VEDEQREQSPQGQGADEGVGEVVEVVEGVVVLAAARPLAPLREGPPPFVQVAAVAATGFVAGAATAAVLGRRFSRVQARRAASGPATVPLRRGEPYKVLSSRRFVVDVHTIAQP
jgi:hypothetical protein